MSETLRSLETAIRHQRGVIKPGEREASMAISGEGEYLGVKISSPTKLLSIAPEEAALVSAVQKRDFEIIEVVTMRERIRSGNMVLPNTAQVMVAHARRTGREIIYRVVDRDGVTVLNEPVSELTPGYSPFFDVAEPAMPEESVFAVSPEELEDYAYLKAMALRGMERAFTLKQGDSRYGAAVVTGSGRVHISGQYSGAPGGRSIHAEMGAIISALTQRDEPITHIGLVSDKFPNRPPDMCGACRQFLADAAAGSRLSPRIVNFARDTDDYHSEDLSSYLPSAWSLE